MARTKITGTGLGLPTADGSALGGASNEYSDLYLADSSIIYFGNDQDVTVTHDPDDGLFFKSIATADNNPFLLTLQTGETDIAADDVIGKIAFQAPDEGTGTDAILVSAGIQARAEGDHSSSSNATSLDFMTGASEAAAKKMSLTSGGDVNVLTDGASLFFGADSEIELRHVADDGLILKHVGTGDGKEPSLTFQAGDNDIAANDVLGSIFFQAPDEGAGTDAILVAAGIEAVSEGDFSSSNNATKLSFKTGASEAATEKMSLSSAGILTIADDLIIGDGKTIGSASDVDAIAIGSDGDVTLTQDLELQHDGAILSFGTNDEIALTHVHDTGLLLTDSGGTPTLQLHDSNESIASDGSKVIITSGGTAFSLPTSDGTNGQAIISNGSGVLSFGDAGGGKILQVVSAFNNDYATHSNTNVDSPAEILTANITPAASSSKILMLGHFTGNSDSGSVQYIGVSLYRDSTHIGFGDNTSRNSSEGIFHTSEVRDEHYSKPGSVSLTFVDSPSTTSQITYRLKAFANHYGSSLSNLTLIQNSGGYNYNNKEQGVGTTTLILMEIGA